jgi:hypothetical protein
MKYQTRQMKDAGRSAQSRTAAAGEPTAPRQPGEFSIVYQSKTMLRPEAWSKYIEEHKGKVAYWSFPWVCENASLSFSGSSMTMMST